VQLHRDSLFDAPIRSGSFGLRVIKKYRETGQELVSAKKPGILQKNLAKENDERILHLPPHHRHML
jgi:hypothetical protein